MATAYTLDIQIDSTQFDWLIANKNKLCIARQTNGSYTVIWETIEMTERAKFSWTEEFRAFWALKFEKDILVETGCNPIPIGYGQHAVIKDNSSMSPATGEINTSGKFSVTNNSQHAVNVGLQSKSGGKWKACFVSPTKIAGEATIEMTPRTVLKIWFMDKAKSESMITDIQGKAIEVVYEGSTDQTVHFSGTEAGTGKWAHGPLDTTV